MGDRRAVENREWTTEYEIIYGGSETWVNGTDTTGGQGGTIAHKTKVTFVTKSLYAWIMKITSCEFSTTNTDGFIRVQSSEFIPLD